MLPRDLPLLHSRTAAGAGTQSVQNRRAAAGQPAVRIRATRRRLPGQTRSECECQALIRWRPLICCDPLLPRGSRTLSNAKQSQDGSAPPPKTINLGKFEIPSERSVWTDAGASLAPVRNSPQSASLMYANANSMETGLDSFESAKSHLFDTSSWGAFCDVTLTLKQARPSEKGAWIKVEDYSCRQAFRHFMNLLNRAVY